MDAYALADQESDDGQVWLKPRLDIIIGHYVTKELIQVKGSHVYVRLRKVNDVLLDANLDWVDFVHYWP